MTVQIKQATLSAGAFTLLHRSTFSKVRLIVTGISDEFTKIPFQTKTNGVKIKSFEASEVKLKLVQTVPSATISAKAPPGVGALEITYELRTGADA